MGLLFSRIWGLLNKEQEYKICIVGLDNAGKTTTLYKLAVGEVVETQPTIASNVEEIVHKNVKLQVWDLGGQESLRVSWTSYFQDTNAVIVVVDSTDRDRMPTVKSELQRILKSESLQSPSIALLVFANKQDLKGSSSSAEISQMLSLHEIKSHQWHIQSCCALTGSGLEEGMSWVVEQIKNSKR
eukprot:c18723_g2_i1.p1 GENE.c18723_g2_i1~~c18723_g2_i1.p1  ORF type:complete len:185 (+),score=66.03 c18723_g2_i1:29-583(+)